MARPELPIEINTSFPITVGDFSEVPEEDGSNKPFELNLEETHDEIIPEILNGCCCTNQIDWRYCWYGDSNNILNNNPKVNLYYNNGCNYSECFTMISYANQFYSPLMMFQIKIDVPYDIFYYPPAPDRDKLLIKLDLYFGAENFYHIFLFKPNTAGPQTVEFNFSPTSYDSYGVPVNGYWSASTYSPYIYFETNPDIHSGLLLNTELSFMTISIDEAIESTDGYIYTNVGNFSESWGGWYRYDVPITIEFLGTQA